MKVTKMKSDGNQPACVYVTAKIHMFENIDDITVANLKIQHIIDQTGTFTYNTAEVISDYDHYYLLLSLSASIYLKLTW